MDCASTTKRSTSVVVSSALAAALLGGFVSHAALARSDTHVVADPSAAIAVSEDVRKAEKRVEKSPESASRRSDLAHAYLASGRFDSAATAFNDALTLGDKDPRTALGLALSNIGSGRNAEAIRVLTKWRDRIPASDFGLAVALAGQPAQAVAILTDVVRGGENTAKSRQNLAYAYALSGQWAQARIIAAQDVPGDQLDARLSDWARTARPADSQARVAGLLGTPVNTMDPGQPLALALGGAGDEAQLAEAQRAPATRKEPAPLGELPALAKAEPMAPVAVPHVAAAPVEAPKPVAQARLSAPEPASTMHFVSRPVIQRLPEVRMSRAQVAAAAVSREDTKATSVRTKSAAKVALAEPSEGTHLVQLGSFRTMEGAKRAWGIFVSRDPRLKDHTMRITEAEVAGRRYYRVAAEGFDRSSARSMCSSVKSRGNGCLAYAESRGLPGVLPAQYRGSGPLRAR